MADERGLDAMIAALRAQDDAPARDVDGTRRRVLASLERGNGDRRRRIAVMVAALTLGTGTLSWAATTGRLAPVLTRLGIGAEGPAEGERTLVGRVVGRVAGPHGARIVEATAASPAPTSPGEAPASRAARGVDRPALEPAPVKRLARPRLPRHDDGAAAFRAADARHLAGDHAAALAAWDGFLARHPASPLAIEARYNRGLVLVRLRRWDDAAAALAPFAAGDGAAGGYRQAEAAALLDAIARRAAKARTP